MAEEADPDKMAVVATKLMQVHAGTAHAIAQTATCLAGGLIQLRSHERGIEKHDDVVAQIKTELIDCINDTYREFSDQLQDDTDYNNHEAVKLVLDKLLGLSYGTKLNTLTTKYTDAFPNSVLAKQVLIALANNLHVHLNVVARWLVVLLTTAHLARRADAITNAIEELASNVGTSLMESHAHTIVEVNTAFDKAAKELDDLAIAENKVYTHLLGEGYTAEEALTEVERRFHVRIQKVLSDGKKDSDTAA